MMATPDLLARRRFDDDAIRPPGWYHRPSAGADDTPVHAVARTGKVPALQALHKAAARFGTALQIDVAQREGMTPLHMALAASHAPMASALLHGGASPVSRCRYMRSPLILAATDDECTMAVLAALSPAQLRRELATSGTALAAGETALHVASRSGCVGAVEALLDAGAEPTARQADGRTPSDVACMDRGRETGNSRAIPGYEAIRAAIARAGAAAAAAAAAAARAGAAPAADAAAAWARSWTAAAGDADVPALHRLAASAGAAFDADAFDPDDPAKRPAILVAAGLPHGAATVLALLALGASVDARSGDGNTALRTAAALGRCETMLALVRSGANVNLCGGPIWHPTLMSLRDSGASMVRVLVAAGANVDARNVYGVTALAGAAFSGQVAVVDALLAVGADARVEADSGETAYDKVWEVVASEREPRHCRDYEEMRAALAAAAADPGQRAKRLAVRGWWQRGAAVLLWWATVVEEDGDAMEM